ncbi:MAG TPA: ABC transporter permease subunit [Ktedonobacteraceae bacterium]|jgi:ABC-type transport system involved in multi-copper enzyme maturation permease subunit|nr:ABC transporter permease subunit [Ktedonobacteraceae bacterium]
MNQAQVLWGSLRYEFAMQIRRRTLWIVFLAITAIYVLNLGGRLFESQTYQEVVRLPLNQVVSGYVFSTNLLTPVALGMLLADRLPRDKQHGLHELLSSVPGTLSARLFGKYLGSLFATIIPMGLCYLVSISFLLYITHSILVIPLMLVDFCLMVLPGLFFIAAFSLACSAFMWVPLYQFLFFGYWFWGNVLPPDNGLPTLSGTIMTPIGTYISTGILGYAQTPWVLHATLLEGIASLLFLLLTPLAVLFILQHYLCWQQARQ